MTRQELRRRSRRRLLSSFLALAALLIALGFVVGLRCAPKLEPEPATEADTETGVRYIEIPAAEQEMEADNRYSGLDVTDDDIETMARLVYLEARGESLAGQRMVAEVVLNRVLHEAFPDTVQAVIFQSGQFSPAGLIAATSAEPMQYQAVQAVLGETPITEEDVVFFSRAGFNDSVFATVGGHVFCRY